MNGPKHTLAAIVCLAVTMALTTSFSGPSANAQDRAPAVKARQSHRGQVAPRPTRQRPTPDMQSSSRPTVPKMPETGAKNIVINFNEADIKVFIKFMAELTGKNYIVDDKVKGKVTVISPKEVSIDEAMKVFESTLQVYGYTLLEAGEIIKIIPAVEAKQHGPFQSGLRHAGDRIIIRLIPLDYIKSDEMVNVIRPLIPVHSFITSYSSTNTLILVDLASNVKKILGIIKKLDIPGHEEELTVVHLKYAGARELADRLSKIFQGNKHSSNTRKPNSPNRSGQSSINLAWSNAKVQIIPDERVNALIVLATKHQTKQIVSLIEQLDIKPPKGQGKINVYYLKNADAEELAKVLNQLTGKVSTTAKKTKSGRNPGSVNLQSEVYVTPDKASNSLVIAASREDYETMRGVIEKLDRRRKQVFVEALIMEITTDRSREFGVEWRATSNFTDDVLVGVGGTNFGNINTVAENPLEAAQGLTIGVVDGIISFGGKDFLNLGALLHALQKESGVNVLSTPNLLTTDNEEAEIVVAQNVPFVTGQSQNTGGTTLTTIERKNIGITLKIKPQISASEIVKLEVYQEISSISPTQIDKAQDLITFTRSVQTTVVVHDKQNIVIGGLIRDDFNEVESKVPLLGDIPGLGWLFKNKSKQKQKTNLLIFLTPHIINSDADIKRITEEKNRLMRVDEENRDAPYEAPLTSKPKEPKVIKEKVEWDTFEDEG